MGFDSESVVICFGKHTFHLRTIERLNAKFAADMAAVLARHFQGGVGTCRTDVQFEVFFVTVQVVFYCAAYLNAVVNIDTVVSVDVHKNAVVRRDFHVYEVLVASLKHIFYNV